MTLTPVLGGAQREWWLPAIVWHQHKLLPGCFRLPVALLEENEARRHHRSSKQCCHMRKTSQPKSCIQTSPSQTQLRGNRNMVTPEAERGKMSNAFLFNYLTSHRFFLIWFKNSSGGLQRRSQGP